MSGPPRGYPYGYAPPGYYAAPPPCVNIGAPRDLLSSLVPLYQRLLLDQGAAGPGDGVALSFVPTCLAASEGTYDEMIDLCAVHGGCAC